jgi:hypothetical protein
MTWLRGLIGMTCLIGLIRMTCLIGLIAYKTLPLLHTRRAEYRILEAMG